MNLLEVHQLCKTYGSGDNAVKALKNVSFSVPKGEYVAIVGESGSGKSTLLNMIGALDTPTSGKVMIDGKNIFSMNDRKLTLFRRRNIGFIFQQFNLLPVLTARENIMMPLLLDRRRPDETDLNRIAGLLGIAGRLDHLPGELSGGQQQRVAVARALIAGPDIIFADEPTGNLDTKSGNEVMELLAGIQENMNKTLIVITHDQRVARMAKRQFSIVDGILTEVTAS